MSLHPAAWIAWLTSVSVFCFVVTNPLYLVLVLAAILVVHASFPPQTSAVGRAVRMFLIAGVVLLVVRVVFIGVLPNPGRTTLFTLPELSTPRFLGGLELGGAVSAEILVAAVGEGLRFIVVLAAFGVFNARADVTGLLRTVPAAFRDVGLVVSIAIAFVPGLLRSMRDVRDAQRLRGETGLRRLAPSLVVPVLGLSLERALLLAESMDARGYGRGEASRTSRMWLTGGSMCLLVSIALAATGLGTVGTIAAALGAAAIVWGFRLASSASPTTRLSARAVAAFDIGVIAAATVATVAAIAAGADASYDPYPVLAWPAFVWTTASITALFLAPGLRRS